MDAWMWAREKKNKDGQRNGPKESLRWVEGYDRIAEMAHEMPGTRPVYVADREADLMPLMLRAQRLAHPADWLVRAAHSRCLVDGGPGLNEVLRLIAQRGGFLARKGDGEPGVKAIWKGLTKIRIVAEALREMNSAHD